MTAHLWCLFIILRELGLENISPSVRWKLWCVCWHIACRCQVSCWTLREFATPNSIAIIWKTKNFFSILWSISRIYPKFQTFWKKGWWPKLMCFRNYRLWKTSSDHYLKSALAEHSLTLNMWKFHKYLRNLSQSDFSMCFHHFERSWFAKYLPFY